MKLYIKLCDILVIGIEYLAGTLLIVMSASTCWKAISRYVLKQASMWTGDLSLFLFVWVVMLGSAAAVYKGKHTAVTLIAEQFPKFLQAVIDYLAIAAVFLCSVLLMTTGWQYFLQNVGNKSSGLVISLGWPAFAMPLGGFLMCLLDIGAVFVKFEKRKGAHI